MNENYLDFDQNILPPLDTSSYVNSGVSGDVTKIQLRGSLGYFALKTFPRCTYKSGYKDGCKGGDAPEDFLTEIEVLSQMNHRNIIELYGTFSSETHVHILLPYINYSLDSYIGCLTFKQVRSFTRQLLRGVQYIHRQGFLHRDLKPANVLIMWDGTVKIIDFGLSVRTRDIPFYDEAITRYYRPPEMILGATRYGTAVDFWSLGCIVAEMVSGKILLRGDSAIHQLYCIFKIFGTPNASRWSTLTTLPHFVKTFPNFTPVPYEWWVKQVTKNKHAIDFIQRLLICEPQFRLSSPETISHPFLTE